MAVLFQRLQRAAADECVPGLFVATKLMPRRFIELREQVEGDVGGLVIVRIGAGDVVAEVRAFRRVRYPPHACPPSGPSQSTPHSPPRPRSARRTGRGDASEAATSV